MITLQVVAVVEDGNGNEVQITYETGLSGNLEDTLVACAMSGLKEWLFIQLTEKKAFNKPLRVVKITAVKEGTFSCKSEPNKEIFSLL